MAESEEELKSLLMKVKEESEKAGLKLNIRSWHLVPSLYGKMRKQWKQWLTLFFWAPKSLQMVTADGEIKRRSLLGRKVMTNLDGPLLAK